ncbi:NAD(P)-dependent oxidoreductase [Bacteroides sp.]|uniref:NAD-dependent epimerase/dehydratase family protein n=1 Tax=Bacteroides sp. TaxID=29523 RepID=UPI002612FD86|nr:NAD-dependent epimerase/dehydratase family protein [Bacteroides sp.]MDD3037284.1 NAD-dependent epimerase/dehydratase family protein [Bacteroides sp.]
MNILVTGATGFVGRHLIPELQKENNHLIFVVRNREKAIELFGHNNITYISTDNLDEIESYAPDCVIHLASYLSSKDDPETLKTLVDTNILFGTLLLNSLKKCTNLRLFINFGTCTEYRLGPMDVSSAYLYSATKTAFRQLLKYYSESSNYRYINIIPYTIYGEADSQKKVMDYIKESLDSQEPVKMSGGEQVLDFIHIDDVVSFINYVMNHMPLIMEQPFIDYHLGTGKGTSIRDLAKIVENKYKRKCNIAWGALPYRESDVMYAVAPIGRLIHIGWESTYRLEDKL